MVETLEWIHKLKNHEAFKRIKSKVYGRQERNVSRNILAYHHGDILLWDESSLSLLSFQLKNFLANPHKDFCQELTWINPPRFEVDNILLANSSSNNLVLFGTEGVQVLSLPSCKVKVDTEGPISCMCSNIDDHFFVTSGHKLIHLKFHPGFSSPDVLFILASDNFIRIYSTEQPQEALTTINLQPLSPTPLSSKSILGDSFVSFDFSEMVEMKTRQPFNHSSTTPTYPSAHLSSTPTNLPTTSITSVPAWHVYLLMGNGQVFYCTVVFDGVNAFRHIPHGSMRMFPAADDNYGLDSCSLLHLPTTPPLLIVATSDGHLHHSLILNPEATFPYEDGEDDAGNRTLAGGGQNDVGGRSSRRGGRGDGGDLVSDDDDGSFLNSIRNLSTSFNQSGRAVTIDSRGIYSNSHNKKALYVYQTVELELQLTTPTCANAGISGTSIDADNDTFYNYPIQLHKDVSNKYRYHCSQANGLHSILPLWLNKMEKFLASSKEQPWSQEDQCIVEHLLCTSPLPNCTSSAAVIGVAQVSDPYLGSHLITLTDHYTLNVIPYLQSHKLETHPLKIEAPFNHTHPPPSENLVTKVTRMLIKDTNNPIISGPLDATLKPEECFSLLCRTTQVFRTQYIAKYDLVRVELDKNISRLEKVKARQQAEQTRVASEMEKYREKQEALKNKLNVVLETQANLCYRLSGLTYNSEKGIPILSDAEQTALSRLHLLEQAVNKHTRSLSLLKKKWSYNGEMISDTHLSKDAFEPTQDKSDSIKKLLKNEGEEIANLLKDLKKAQISVGI